MGGAWRYAAATVAAFALAPAVGAQQASPPAPVAEVPETTEFVQEEWLSWRLPGWTFLPGLTIGAFYDSNVALDDAPATTGRTESDSLFQVQPSGRIEYNSARTTFSTGYRGSLRRYVEADELNCFDQRMTASVRHRVTRFVSIVATNQFHDVASTDEVVLNGAPFSRTGTRANTFSGGFTARLTRSLNAEARYEHTWVTFDPSADAETFLIGGVVHGIRGSLSRRLSGRLTAGGEYAVRFASMNEGTREIFFQDAGATVTYALGPRTSISGAAGVSLLRDRTLDDSRSGPFLRAGIVHGIERIIVGANYQRSLVPSFGFGGSSGNQALSGFVRMPLASNRAYVQASLAWRRSDPFLETTLEVDRILARTTVGYALQRWLRLEGFHAYSHQDSVITGGEIDRHRVGLLAVLAQPLRIR